MLRQLTLFLFLCGTAIGLQPGWNNLPAPAENLADYVTGQPGVERILGWENREWKVWDRKNLFHLRGFAPLHSLKTTQAYWIYLGPASSLYTVGNQGDISIHFTLLSTEPLNISFKFSADDGRHFQPTENIRGNLENLLPGTHSVIWESLKDLRRNLENTRLSLVATLPDQEQFETVSLPFYLENFSGTEHPTGPNITNLNPGDRETGIGATQAIRIQWDRELMPASLNGQTRIFCNQESIAHTQRLSGPLLILEPIFQYPLQAECRLELLGGIQDRFQTPLAQTFASVFYVESFDQTSPPPFPELAQEEWNQTRIRQILHTFAFGGPASEAQIQRWSGMKPLNAVAEMLSPRPVNPRLSPPANYDRMDQVFGSASLRKLAEFLSSEAPENPVTAAHRRYFALTDWNAAPYTWCAATLASGLNPFLHWLGMMETNYHMAVNRNVGVGRAQILDYYDTILTGHIEGKPYQQIMADAAVSAAIAVQYNHRRNEFRNGIFRGNEDFAREFHQLFFGILGTDEEACQNAPSIGNYLSYPPNKQCQMYHEDVTVRGTARALSGMPVSGDFHLDYTISYPEETHHTANLEILGTPISGSNASEKIHLLAETSILHPESLHNLPINLIRMFVEDAPDPATEEAIREAWASMPTKNLIRFLQSYAASPLFHRPKRLKYFHTIERVIRYFNLSLAPGAARWDRLLSVVWFLEDEGVQVFAPSHDVFGGQTGQEASLSGSVMRNHHDYLVANPWTSNKLGDIYNQIEWRRDFSTIIPKASDGTYPVVHVAEWLWNYLIADDLKHFGTVERAQVYALLNRREDFSRAVSPESPDLIYTQEQIENPAHPAHQTYLDLSREVLDLLGNPDVPWECESCDSRNQRAVNQRIGMALNFIAMTPWFFALEGL